MKIKYIFAGYWPDYEAYFIKQAGSEQFETVLFNPRKIWAAQSTTLIPRWIKKPFRAQQEKALIRKLFNKNESSIFIIPDSELILDTLTHYPQIIPAHILVRNTLQPHTQVGSLILTAQKQGYPIWSFDQADCTQYGFHFYNQFIDRLPAIAEIPTQYDLFFIGLDKGRLPLLQTIQNLATSTDLSCQLDIRSRGKRHTKHHLNYLNYLRAQCSGKCIIDIVKKGQTGLTLRPLEATLYQRKLLTNNPSVLKLPFYNTNNILFFEDLNGLNAQKLKTFMDRPLQAIAPPMLQPFSINAFLSQLPYQSPFYRQPIFMTRPKILLVMPAHVNLITPIKMNLEFHGFTVTAFSSKQLEQNFQYPNLKEHWRLLLHKHILRDASEKELLKKQWASQQLALKIDGLEFDYALVIRPDLFAKELIQKVRQHTRYNLAAYQWDGFERYPEITSRVFLFDRFFVFNPQDIIQHPEIPLLGTTNFYFDDQVPHKRCSERNIAYFIGAHIPERTLPIVRCANALTTLGVDLNFMIATRKKKYQKYYKNQKINFIKKPIDFSENLNYVQNANILLDFVNPVHQGLSFRIFDALQYQKKLITNNITVKSYDFYHPNNIFIWDGEDLSGLHEFLTQPLQPIDSNIVKKYGFGNWIKNILDMAPYQPIDLPKISKPNT